MGLAVMLSGRVALAAPVHWSFEDNSLDGWQATGALGALVSNRANFANHPQIAFNKEGMGFLSTLVHRM